MGLNEGLRSSHWGAISFFSLMLAGSSSLEAKSDCDKKIGAIARELSKTIDQPHSENRIEKIANQVEGLTSEGADLAHAGRLQALSRAFVFFALYAERPDLLAKVFEAILVEEDKLIEKTKNEGDPSEKRVLVESLVEFNRRFYSTLSHADAEYFLAMAYQKGIDPVSSKNLGRWLELQYQNQFSEMFPLDVNEVSQIDETRGWETRPLLIRDLHSLELNRSLRARFFLSLTHRVFTEAAGLKMANSFNPYLNFLMDIERDRSRAHEITGFERSDLPIGKVRGKEADYRGVDDQERNEVRMLANSFEAYQMDPHDRRSQETVMKLILESMTPSQLFQIIPDGEVSTGLTLYQLCQLSPIRSIQALSKTIAKAHPWFQR